MSYKMNKSTFSPSETNANSDQLDGRLELQELFKTTPIPLEELMSQLGLT